MRTSISPLRLFEPRSLRHALRLLADEGPLVPLAGCTDVYVSLNAGVAPGARFLNLWDLDELRRIDVRGSRLVVGALATYAQIARSKPVQKRLPMLVAAAREIGGIQIQNRGTIGGNVGTGSPAGDSLPVLAAADAVVVLESARGRREVPLTGFYTGYRASVRRPDELIVAVEIPAVEGRQWFRKVGTRAAQAISKVVMAGVRSDRPRVALGSVAPTVIRATRTEAVLAETRDVAEARRVLMTEISPIDDVRSTAAYRRWVAGNLLERFWGESTSS